MESITERMKRLSGQDAPTVVPASIDEIDIEKLDDREKAILNRYTSKAPDSSILKRAARAEAKAEILARRQQRAYAEKAPPEAAASARELQSNLGDRAKTLEIMRQMTPAQREEALKLVPGISQQLGDDRGGVVGRTLGAVSRGISHGVSQPAMEMVGAGGTPEEIAYIRQLDAAASQEFSPARPGDPWYQSGPLQALQQAPWMATVIGGGGAGTGIAKAGGQLLARGASAGVPLAKPVFQAAGAVGKIPKIVGLKGATTKATMAKAGQLTGITAASFPGQYAQEVDQLKELGMEDGVWLRTLAGSTAAISGLLEGVVPNPLKTGDVPLTQGAAKAARMYLWEAFKKAPGEMSEEYLQGVTSGVGDFVAQYLDQHAKEKSLGDAFRLGWEQVKEAALPMAFLLGVPAAGGAGLAAASAQNLPQALPDQQQPNQQPPSTGHDSQRVDPLAVVSVLQTLAEQRKQKLAELDKPPSAHKWAETVLGDRRRYKEAPDEATRTQQWQQAKGATAPPTTPTTPQGVPNASEVQPNEGSTQVQGNGGQGSQVHGSSEIRGQGQGQGGTQPTSQEPKAPQVQVEDQSQATQKLSDLRKKIISSGYKDRVEAELRKIVGDRDDITGTIALPYGNNSVMLGQVIYEQDGTARYITGDWSIHFDENGNVISKVETKREEISDEEAADAVNRLALEQLDNQINAGPPLTVPDMIMGRKVGERPLTDDEKKAWLQDKKDRRQRIVERMQGSTVSAPQAKVEPPATETRPQAPAQPQKPTTPTTETKAPAQAESTATAIRRGEVGGKLSAGEVVTTASGRKTTPFPEIRVDSERKAKNTLSRVDKWLHENAVEEARSRGDDFNLRMFENENPAKLPPASKDSMEEYLFGEHPAVISTITKPLVRPEPESTQPQKPIEPTREQDTGTTGEQAGTKPVVPPKPAEQPKAETKKQEPSKSPRVYREMAADELDSMINPSTSSGETFGGDARFWSDNPDLAIGQGTNKGFLVELDPSGLKLQEHSKPGTAIPGVGKEFTSRHRAHEFRPGIRSITIKPGQSSSSAIRVRRFLEAEVKAGKWSRSRTEGGEVVYTPIAEGKSSTAVSPPGAAQTTKQQDETATDSLRKMLDDVNAKIASQGRVVDDRLLSRKRELERLIKAEDEKQKQPEKEVASESAGWQPVPPSGISATESPDLKLETSRREKANPQFTIDVGSPVTVYRRNSKGKEEMQPGVVEDFADHMPANIRVRLSDGTLATPLVADVGPPRSISKESGSQRESTEVSSDAELEEMIEAEFDSQLGKKVSGKKQAGRKPSAPSTSSDKPKTRIRKAADTARQEADDLWAEFNKRSKETLKMGLDPDLARLAVRIALAEIKAGTLSFAAFVESTVAKVPADMLDKVKPYMEMSWKVAHKRGMTEDPGGKFDDFLRDEAVGAAPPTDITAQTRIAHLVRDALENGQELTSQKFFAIADEEFGGTRANNDYGDSQATDALELGVNLYLEGKTDANVSPEKAKEILSQIKQVMQLVPRHRGRTGNKDLMQQFSTPPAYAYAVNWIANVTDADVVLEPSAGMGGIAIHAANSGAKVYANELDPSRADGLRELPLEKVFTEDAEQIGAILKGKMPGLSVIVMNPPFTRAGMRMGDRMIQGTDRKHIDEALSLLPDGGRLVAIVGAGLHGQGQKMTQWLNNLPYQLTANIEVARDVYRGYGTEFPTRVLVIDKVPRTKKTVSGVASDLSELIDLAKEVRNARMEQNAAQSASAQGDTGDGQGTRPADDVRDTTGSGVPSNSDTGAREAAGGQRGHSGGDSLGTVGDATGGTSKDAGNGRGGRQSGGSTRKSSRPSKGSKAKATGDPNSGKPDGGSRGRGGNRGNGLTKVKAKSQTRAVSKKTELGDSTFEVYSPSVVVEGSKSHPAPIVESAAMAAVDAPKIDYEVDLMPGVLEGYVNDDGAYVGISDIQLEAIAMAGSAHEQMLPNGERRGFLIGDGTGVGKAREALGIIMDDFIKRGTGERRKAVFITKNDGLVKDAINEWVGVGGDPAEMQPLSDISSGATVNYESGVLSLSYDTLKGEASVVAKAQGNTLSRVEQIVDWVGEDFDGVIVFDEAHLMANSMDTGTGTQTRGASMRALAGVDLQQRLPNARFVYLSATAATEVRNLAYAERLGLWGPGTAFDSKHRFVSEIEAGGVAAMEKVAADMKAMGMYIARNLSYDDGTPNGRVEFDRIPHTLSNDQRRVYDKLSEAWLKVLSDIDTALGITGNERGKSRILSAFWSANQRFWNDVVTTMMAPTLITAIENDLKSGRSVVIQLSTTKEAATGRAIAGMKEGQTYDEIDASPRRALMEYVERAFPTQRYETYIDESGNERTRPVFDSEGKPVHDPQAVAMKERLMDEIGSLDVAARGPIDMIVDHFGKEMVSEISGRSQRLVKGEDGRLELEKRGKAASRADRDSFMDGKKRVLIFSEAGGTGASYHASLSATNQQRRSHYLWQPGWSAPVAVQGLGRAHRSNQASAPMLHLLEPNLEGYKRFISTIARRLGQLGALTKGQRTAADAGLFGANDNLESTEANSALFQFMRDAVNGDIDGIDREFLVRRLGLEQLVGNADPTPEMFTMTQFLNRLLNLPLGEQSQVFGEFQSRLDSIVAQAIQDGTLDQGMETLKAEKIVKANETVVNEHKTGAKTKLVELTLTHKVKLNTFEAMLREVAGYAQSKFSLQGFVKSTTTGRVFAVVNQNRTSQDSKGRTMHDAMFIGVNGNSYGHSLEQIENAQYWEQLPRDQAKELWEKQFRESPSTQDSTTYLLTGALLPVWNKIPGEHSRVIRALTTEGETILGRVIPERLLQQTIDSLGVSFDRTAKQYTPLEGIQAIYQGGTVELANGWKIKKRAIDGEDNIEIIGPDYSSTDGITNAGGFTRRIDYKTRFFIPFSDTRGEVLREITRISPITSITNTRSGGNSGERVRESALDAFTSPELQNRQSMGAARVPIASAADLVEDDDGGGTTSPYASPNEKLERRWQKAVKGIGKKTLWTKVLEFGRELVKSTVRGSLPELPRTKAFGEARSAMHAYQNAPVYAQLATADLLKKTTKPLSADDFDLFTRVVIMRDQVEAADKGELLSFGLTPDEAREELERVEALAEKNERVQASLEYRKQWTEAMVDDFLAAHEYLGMDMTDRFKRENYFRHQVLYYMAAEQRGLGKKKVELTPSRGWLKGRTSGDDRGEAFDINANYLQAEWEVATQMIADTKRAQAIGRIKRHYDKMRELKAQAKQNNYVAVVGGPANMKKIEELRSKIAELRAIGSLDSGEIAQLKAWSEQLWALDPTMPFRQQMAMAREKIESESDEDVSDDFMRYVAELAKQDNNPLQGPALGFLKAVADRKAFIKSALGDKYETWEDVVPDDHEEVAIRPGRAMFQAYSVPEQVASELMADLSKTLGITAEDLRPLTALGSKYTPLVVPQEVAAQMMSVDNKMDFGWLDRMVTKPMNAWKRWRLQGPTNVIKYNLRNLSEVDKVMALNPAALKDIPQAIRDLWKLYSGADDIPATVRDWVERGGSSTLVRVNELGELNELKDFARLVGDKKSGVVGKIVKAPANLWRTYWSKVGLGSDFRESILRYASYLNYLKQLESGKLTNYGGSVRAEVDGIVDNKDKAMRLSADLLGDYSDISIIGQFTRSRLAPFWSFQETNLRTYFRGLINLASNEQSAIKAGMQVAKALGIGGLSKTPFLAYKLGRIAILFYGFKALTTALNRLIFPDDDDELPNDEKSKAHLTLGRNSKGEVQYFSRLGTAADVLDWVGLDSVDYDLRDVLDGRRTLQEVVNDMVMSPVDKAYGMLSPFIKAPSELAVGKTAYPSVGKSRPIRDRGKYIAQNLGVAKEYDKLMGNPSTPYSITDFLLYKVEPGTSAYYLTLDAKARWLKKERNRGVGYSESSRGDSLRNYKMALRLNDKAAADKYLAKFEAEGGKDKGLLNSLEWSHPAGGLSAVDAYRFYRSLSPVEQDEYRKAERFYYSELLTEGQAKEIRSRRYERIKDLAEGKNKDGSPKGEPEKQSHETQTEYRARKQAWKNERQTAKEALREYRSAQ